MLARTLASVAFLIFSLAARAETPGKLDLEAAETAARLIGTPVLAADGSKVGEIADILLDEYGVPLRLRMRLPMPLGFGERSVDVPPETYVMRDGAIVIMDLSAKDVQALLDATEAETKGEARR